ncbi:transposase [Umezawaea sp. Da 62-37]|uniref:transposase n=1 Tax=Umezawaea sp. Da 62-37 TaxID=3075927 RepID=UPI0037DDC541
MRVSWTLSQGWGRPCQVLDRHDLRDEERKRLRPLLPMNPSRGGRRTDHQAIINRAFWRTRTSSPWRDMPADYGPRLTVGERQIGGLPTAPEPGSWTGCAPGASMRESGFPATG